MTPVEEFAHDVRTWARQTVIFTLQFEISGTNGAVDDHARVINASGESLKVINDLWAYAENGSPDPSHTAWMFVRHVLDWSAAHLTREATA